MMEVMMSKVFKICFGLAMFVVFYFIGWVATATIHSYFAPADVPEQTLSIEELASAFEQQHENATPWETCEQEVE